MPPVAAPSAPLGRDPAAGSATGAGGPGAEGPIDPAVRVVAPRQDDPSCGHADPGSALGESGVPGDDGARALVVVVNDPERGTRTEEALAALRERAPTRRFEILVATGSHVFPAGVRAEHAARLRAAAGDPVRIAWHEGDDPGAVRPLPGCGRPVSRYFQAASAGGDVVVVGSVEPHWFAGVTGAHKALSVGLWGTEAIRANHRLAMEPTARPFALDDNPVHTDLLGTVRELLATRRVVALQHVGSRWFAGDPLALLPALADVAARRWLVRVPEPLETVFCRVRPPLDRSLYQAEKAVKLVEHAVRDGGTIVLDAACPDGIGPRRFADALAGHGNARDLRAAIERDGYRLGDHKAVRLRALFDRGVRVVVRSGVLSAEAARAVGFSVDADAQIPAGPRTLVVEDAAHLVVRVDGRVAAGPR